MVDVHEVEDPLDLPLGIGDDVLEEDGVLIYALVPLIIGDLKKKNKGLYFCLEFCRLYLYKLIVPTHAAHSILAQSTEE